MANPRTWLQLVKEMDEDRNEDIVVYTFGNNRTFKEKQNKGYN